MVKSLSVMGITDSDFPMSSIIGRANLLLTTSIGGGVHVGIKKPVHMNWLFCAGELCRMAALPCPAYAALAQHVGPVSVSVNGQ
ncbi:hypothetical protein CFF91_02500 [Salmonella enterica]|nr:hypothetical protein [Salmonella enterica]EDC7490292.1 hypothetical protein [Salmonella enterica]